MAGDAPPALPSLPLWPGRGRKLYFCGWRERTERGREDPGFSPVLRPAVSVRVRVWGRRRFTGEGEAAALQNNSSSLGAERFWRKGSKSASRYWDHWDCLKLYPGALSCLSAAASFIVIEPPGDGSRDGDIMLSGTDLS